jgi:sugar lactone lactonase YvrE
VTASRSPDATAGLVLAARAQLGECPLWSEADQRLYWVDIDGGAVHRFDPATGSDESVAVPGRPGSIALTGTPGRLLVAVEGRLGMLEFGTEAWQDWRDIEPPGTGNRFNDGRCDAAGRFWVGSMYEQSAANRATGVLYRVQPDGTSTPMRTDIGVPNALAFSPDGRTMYWADTHHDVVWAYDYDIDDGVPTRERVFLDFADLPGRPDGACVDEDGGYWIACVYGSAVLRATPDGAVDRIVSVPVAKPTMPAFGGPDRSTLYVTTIGGGASHSLDPNPDAGGLFALETERRGLPEWTFAGPTAPAAPSGPFGA